MEACLVCLIDIRTLVEAAQAEGVPQEPSSALTLPRLEASIHRTLNLLDTPVVTLIPEHHA